MFSFANSIITNKDNQARNIGRTGVTDFSVQSGGLRLCQKIRRLPRRSAPRNDCSCKSLRPVGEAISNFSSRA